jgi:ribonucleoside-diphosphate reductase alpha chain
MNNEAILVTKRNGTKEPLDLDKIHKVLMWAGENLDVSVSQVEINAKLHFFNGIETKDIHNTLIKSAANLISVENPDYQYFAARLLIFQLKKEAFGDYVQPDFYVHIRHMIKLGFYDSEIINQYTEEEIDTFDHYMKHERDNLFTYAAAMQMSTKYLMHDRNTNKVLESPQQAYMLIAMYLFMSESEDKAKRTKYVFDFYDALSTFKISLPTPIMGGVRSPIKQFSSCCLIEAGDSLDSINAVNNAIVNYVSKRAGIGINAGAIRSLGSSIRGGKATHTGNIPFYKLFNAAVHSCSQGGLRSGAATLFYPIWTYELQDLLVLKNNRGIEENRVRTIDYGVQINKYFYERLRTNGVISLFSPSEVPGLYEAFFSDQEEFKRIYEAAESNPDIRKIQLPAKDVFSLLIQERASTGRIYIQHVDHSNLHGPFKPELAPVKQSNLCMEVLLPTSPLSIQNPDSGEIALCTLAAFNVGLIQDDEWGDLANILVRALDNLLSYQDYPELNAAKSAKKRRSLGIGVINFAYYLAKNKTTYSNTDIANDLTFKLFEKIQYNLLTASCNLAKEKGSCVLFKHTKYSDGLLPFEWCKPEAKELCDTTLTENWEELRADIAKYGLRNSTLTSLMPSESSSIISNSTNGIEPPRSLMTVKQSKDMTIKQLVPEIDNPDIVKNYELLWDMVSNEGYLQKVAIAQMFVDQSISTNTNYNPLNYPDNKVPMGIMLKDIAMAYKYGVKTLYYHNTRDAAGEELDDGCASGACKI